MRTSAIVLRIVNYSLGNHALTEYPTMGCSNPSIRPYHSSIAQRSGGVVEAKLSFREIQLQRELLHTAQPPRPLPLPRPVLSPASFTPATSPSPSATTALSPNLQVPKPLLGPRHLLTPRWFRLRLRHRRVYLVASPTTHT